MTFDEQKLYDLLPAIYRIRDAERLDDRGQIPPLQALLRIIAGQASVLEENLAQLYDDQFAETCAPWVLAYLGDLIGIEGLPSAGLETLNSRAMVGHTIGYRRRKGTAAVLEQLARDVTRWPARAVEMFQLLATTQYLNHLRPENQSFISVRGAERLEYLGSAFEHATTGDVGAGASSGPARGHTGVDLTHTVDVRRIASGRGRYNIPNVGIFLWRLREFRLTRSPAVPRSPGHKTHFFFNPLGCDLPLFNSQVTEDEVTHLAEPLNVPDRITRRRLDRNFEEYYGEDKSLLIERKSSGSKPELKPIPSSEIIVCNLSTWPVEATNKIEIDPVLGRIVFPDDQTDPPFVTFYYGFSAEMGGGEYNRLSSFDNRKTRVLDDQGRPIVKKVDNTLRPASTIAKALADEDLKPNGGTVEILNSGRYEEKLGIDATGQPNGEGKRIVIRAADKHRPTLVLNGELAISGGKDDEVILDGLLIAGGAIRVLGPPNALGRLRLSHCTLVPGISLDVDGKPLQAGRPSLIVDSANARVEIDHCILGAIVAAQDAEVTISDSIVDATKETSPAYDGTKEFGAPLRIQNSTVIGRVRTRTMRLATNTIILASPAPGGKGGVEPPVFAQRRQEGCVRFSYLSPGAQVPVRYYCQPESDDSLVRPRFVSTHFNHPAYCQLNASCPTEIRRGADDEGSMGAFHSLYEPQRESHLLTRLDEYLRFGLEAGIFYVT